MRKGIFILAVLPWLAFACSKEPVKVDTTNGQQINRRLIIEVKHRYDVVQGLDSLLPGVTVKLFLDPTDRDEDLHIEKLRSTDSLGLCTIEQLLDTNYYIRLEHDSLGTLDELVSITSQTTTAYEYFYYY